jgi:hypothetical protein
MSAASWQGDGHWQDGERPVSRTDIIARRVDRRDRAIVRVAGWVQSSKRHMRVSRAHRSSSMQRCEGVLRIAGLQSDDLHDRLTPLVHVASRNITRRAYGWQVSGRG